MKTSIKLLIIILVLFFFNNQSFADGYKIKVKINGLKDTTIYSGYHFGEKNFALLRKVKEVFDDTGKK